MMQSTVVAVLLVLLLLQYGECWRRSMPCRVHESVRSMTILRDVDSKTHAKQLARVLRNKEKEKAKNRLKTHLGKEYNKLKRTRSLPRVMPPTKREIKFARSLPSKGAVAPAERIDVPPLESDPLLPQIKTIVSSAMQRKASNVSVIRVSALTSAMQFVVVVEGTNKPQLQALMDGIKLAVLEQHQVRGRVEGTSSSGWALIDFGPIYVNIMTASMRNYYKLEERWKEGEFADLSALGVETLAEAPPDEPSLSPESASSPGTASSIPIDSSDPFWS